MLYTHNRGMAKKKAEFGVLPLHDALLFPHMILPMHVYEKSYLELLDYAMGTTKKIAITLKKPGFEAEPAPGAICCLGDITYTEDALLENAEGKAVIVSGTERVRLIRCIKTSPFITAEVETVPDTCSSQTMFDHYKEILPQKLIQFLFLKNVPDRDIHLANLIVDPGHIADFATYYFVDDMYLKLALLETADVCERCKKIEELLDQSIEATQRK